MHILIRHKLARFGLARQLKAAEAELTDARVQSGKRWAEFKTCVRRKALSPTQLPTAFLLGVAAGLVPSARGAGEKSSMFGSLLGLAVRALVTPALLAGFRGKIETAATSATGSNAEAE